MKYYQKDCKNLKQVNNFLKSIGLGDFEIDILNTEYDFDGWINEEETKGISIQVNTKFEVYVTKYSRKDIERLEQAP